MKIGFCGTMSVGKTTLVNALKETNIFTNCDTLNTRPGYRARIGDPLHIVSMRQIVAPGS